MKAPKKDGPALLPVGSAANPHGLAPDVSLPEQMAKPESQPESVLDGIQAAQKYRTIDEAPSYAIGGGQVQMSGGGMSGEDTLTFNPPGKLVGYDSYGGPAGWERAAAINNSCRNITDLATAWVALKGSKTRDEIAKALQAEADNLLRLQGERDGMPQSHDYPKPDPKRRVGDAVVSPGIARNGNKPAR